MEGHKSKMNEKKIASGLLQNFHLNITQVYRIRNYIFVYLTEHCFQNLIYMLLRKFRVHDPQAFDKSLNVCDV